MNYETNCAIRCDQVSLATGGEDLDILDGAVPTLSFDLDFDLVSEVWVIYQLIVTLSYEFRDPRNEAHFKQNESWIELQLFECLSLANWNGNVLEITVKEDLFLAQRDLAVTEYL